MQMGNFILPDKCPEDCSFKEDLRNFSQGGMCNRCPVLCCTSCDEGWSLVDVSEYRLDWAAEWDKFFKTGEYPMLPLSDTTANTTVRGYEHEH